MKRIASVALLAIPVLVVGFLFVLGWVERTIRFEGELVLLLLAVLCALSMFYGVRLWRRDSAKL